MVDKMLHVLISGRVQGVFFRAATREHASQLGLRGWVRNLPDGRVEALFEGGEEHLAEMLDWCHRGPPGSLPEEVRSRWEKAKGEFTCFRIRHL
jgi:acylphosphatase